MSHDIQLAGIEIQRQLGKRRFRSYLREKQLQQKQHAKRIPMPNEDFHLLARSALE